MTHPLIIINQHVKFQINWISNIGDMARTWNYYEIFDKRGITQKVKNLEL